MLIAGPDDFGPPYTTITNRTGDLKAVHATCINTKTIGNSAVS